MLTWRHPLLPPRNLRTKIKAIKYRMQSIESMYIAIHVIYNLHSILQNLKSCTQITGQSRVTLVTHDKGCVRYPTEGNSSNHELTTAMHHLLSCLARDLFLGLSSQFQILVRFFVYCRIKPHNPLLVRLPVYSFEFQPCGRTSQADLLTRQLSHSEGRYSEQREIIVQGVDYWGI